MRLSILGGYEKEELARASENVARLQRSQLVIDIDEVDKDQWIIAFTQERNKSQPNEQVLTVTARGAVSSVAMWESHMEMRVASSQAHFEQTIAARKAIIAKAQEYADAKNWTALADMFDNFDKLFRSSNALARLDQQFSAEVDAARTNVSRIEAEMRWWYVIGTAALLLSTIVSNVLLERSFRKLERQLPKSRR